MFKKILSLSVMNSTTSVQYNKDVIYVMGYFVGKILVFSS